MNTLRQHTDAIPLRAIRGNDDTQSAASVGLDIDDARRALANGSVAAAKIVAQQATNEQVRIDKIRSFLCGLEEKLFDAERVASLPLDLQLKLYAVASANLSRSVNFLQELTGTFADAMNVLSEVEQFERASRERNTAAPDPELEKIKAMLLKRIQEKVEHPTFVVADASRP